jgi:Tfp pilus assembly protein PilO
MFKLKLPSKIGEGNKLGERRAIVLLFILIAAFFFRSLLMPDFSKLKTIYNENRVRRDELNKRKIEFISIEELARNPKKYEEEYVQTEKMLASLEEKIEYLKSMFVKKESLAEIINYLTIPAKAGEIEFNLISMDALISHSHFQELPIKMKMTADFLSFLHYIHAIESLPIIIDMKELKLYSPESTGVLNIEANLAIYVSL